jgi:hypothetical protein
LAIATNLEASSAAQNEWRSCEVCTEDRAGQVLSACAILEIHLLSEEENLKKLAPLSIGVILVVIVGLAGYTRYSTVAPQGRPTPMPTASPTPQSTIDPQTQLDRELHRLSVLLSESRVGRPIQEIPSTLTLTSVTPLATKSFETAEPKVIAHAFFLEKLSDGAQIIAEVEAQLPSTQKQARFTTNGRWLLYAYTAGQDATSTEAKYGLASVVSAFAGDE